MWPDEGHSDANAPGRASTGSEVIAVNGQPPPAAAAVPLPPNGQAFFISSVNLANSPRSHIGNKYITNIHQNEEAIKGGCLGFELTSPVYARRLRCSVAVFVCWALVTAALLASYFFYWALSAESILNIGLNETWYLRRPDWQAMPPSSAYKITFLKLPVKTAMIGHSATDRCEKWPQCIRHMRQIQQDHLERYGEIGPNFLVGGEDGLIFEGAGANVVGSTTEGWNSRIVSIMFIGNYEIPKDKPNENQLNHVDNLLSVLVKDKVLDENYDLFAYCQIKTFTISPGQNILRKLSRYSHWNNDTSSCL